MYFLLPILVPPTYFACAVAQLHRLHAWYFMFALRSEATFSGPKGARRKNVYNIFAHLLQTCMNI